MAKSRSQYLCRECGGVQAQWMGKCPDCGAWDALERYIEPKPEKAGHASAVTQWIGESGTDDAGHSGVSSAIATRLSEIAPAEIGRHPTGVSEFDRVLGGGMVPGSVVLLGGDPGIGKSTLLLQAAGVMAHQGSTVLYVTSEESAYQTRLRAERLFSTKYIEGGIDAVANLFVLAETNLGKIIEQARRVQPRVLVLDSIQMVFNTDLEAAPGSIAQLRRCATDLVYLAKVSGMAVVLVGHVTKDGQLAGPKLLEHLVDVVLSFEGDEHHAHRVVRGVKNRYGTTLEVGLFEMTSDGLVEVTDPTLIADPGQQPRAGSVLCPAMHGSRCLLVEIQALTAVGFLGSAKRRASGLDTNRLAMLIAVLEKHAGLRLADQDVFVSAVGGLKVMEPATDLAVCLAIAGAHLNRCQDSRVAVVGEVGLGGEIRSTQFMEQRLRECGRLGVSTVLCGPSQMVRAIGGATPQVIGNIAQGLEYLGPSGPASVERVGFGASGKII